MGVFSSDRDASARPAADSARSVPTACPACRSPSVTTTAKHPDATTYWRCEACGEVWNVSRRQPVHPGGPRWR